MRSGRSALLILAVAACLAAPASASASVTFGADVDNLSADVACLNCGAVSYTHSDGSPDRGSPIAGVVVQVRVRTWDGGAAGSVRILHPSTALYEFINTSEMPISVPADATVGGQVREFPARLKVAFGDRLGIYFEGTTVRNFHMDSDALCGTRGGPPQAVGDAGFYPPTLCGGDEALIQGRVEPDADLDGFGDETQDGCPAQAGTQGACVKKCKKKHRKRSAAATKKKKNCKKKKRKK
jgi:hypothetical protein